MTSARVVKALGLEAPYELPEDLDGLLGDTERAEARERGLRLLEYRDRSASELRSRLRDDGYPAAIASETVARFVEIGLVDDSRFAALFVRSRAAQGHGSRRIARELGRRGIDETLAQSALESELPNSELERAVATLRGRAPADRKARERLIRRLVARGFDFGTAIRAVDEVERAAEGEQDP